MTNPVKLLLIFMNDTDTLDGVPLYHAAVDRLRHLGIAGATAQLGLLGYGHHRRLRQKGLFGVMDAAPVTVMAVDDEARLRAVLPEIRSLVREGLVLLLDAELVADVAGPSAAS